MDLTSIGVNNLVYINDISACTIKYSGGNGRHWVSKLTHSFWLMNGSIRLKTVANGETYVITRPSDFLERNVFPIKLKC